MNEFSQPDSPLHQLISDTFPGAKIDAIAEIGQGRGIFSRVVKVQLHGAPIPTVVVKAPALGVNGSAARSSGAYFREALAYTKVLEDLKVRTPLCYAVANIDNDPWFVLEDLSHLRTIDQLDGISKSDAMALTEVLAQLHEATVAPELTDQLRGPGPERFAIETLRVGFESLATKWDLDQLLVTAFKRLLDDRASLVGRFVEAGQDVLTHGDPRADNIVISDGAAISETEVVLLDWQQISMSFGEADLAWLLATSCTVHDRPEIEQTVLSRYAKLSGSDINSTRAKYRLGLTRPGLAVLMLSTRNTSDARTTEVVRTSLERIGRALADNNL